MRTILFICTGNTCRSPMAEGIARSICLQRQTENPLDSEWFIASAGIWATDGMPYSHETVEALMHRGIELNGTSKHLTAEMVRNADVVYCMTQSHLEAARSLVSDDPDLQVRILPLDPNGDVEDPIGQGQAAYDRLMDTLYKLISSRLEKVLI